MLPAKKPGIGTIHAVFWVLLLTLCGVGIYAAVNRASVVRRAIRTPPPPGLAPADRRSLEYLTGLVGLEPDTPRYRQIEASLEDAAERFNARPLMTLLHVLPGALFLLFAPLQFVARLRGRHPAVHRWCGRGLLLVAVPGALTGLVFAVVEPVSGPVGGAASLTFGVLFVVFGIKAYAAIRRRDVARHREWMLRFVALALGIAVVRVLEIVLLAVTRASPETLAGPSFWLGWLASLAVAEWWIRSTRSPAGVTSVKAAGR